VLTSPAHATGTDRLAEAARGIDAEIVINVQGDEPLLDPYGIDAVAEALADDSSLEMATLSLPLRSLDEMLAASVVKVVTDARGDALYFSRSPIPHVRQGAGSDAQAAARGRGRARARAQARRALRLSAGGAPALRRAPPIAARGGRRPRAAACARPRHADPRRAAGRRVRRRGRHTGGPRARARAHRLREGNTRLTKYIFVTGGVVSSLGKGLASASIGALLEGHGFRVAMMKCDPTSTSTPAR
jgi:hypothetical protein